MGQRWRQAGPARVKSESGLDDDVQSGTNRQPIGSVVSGCSPVYVTLQTPRKILQGHLCGSSPEWGCQTSSVSFLKGMEGGRKEQERKDKAPGEGRPWNTPRAQPCSEPHSYRAQ